MHLAAQLAFDLAVYATGFVVLRRLLSSRPFVLVSVAYPVGVGIWGIGTVAALLISVPLNRVTIAAAVALVALAAELLTRRHPAEPRRTWMWFVAGLSTVAAAAVVLRRYSHWILTPDSLAILGASDVLAVGGRFPPPGLDPVLVEYIAQQRFDLLAGFLAAAGVFGGDFYAVLFPLSALTLALSLTALVWDSDWPETRGAAFAILAPILLLSVPAFWYHAFYVNQHLLVSGFFTLAILLSASTDTSLLNRTGGLIGALVGVTAWQRPEMLLCGLVPMAALLTNPASSVDAFRRFALGVVVVAAPLVLWRAQFLGLSRSGNSWAMVQVALLAAYLGALFLARPLHRELHVRRAVVRYAMGLGAAVIVAGLYYESRGTLTSIVNLSRVMFLSDGVHGWGWHWIAVGLFVVGYLVVSTARTPHLEVVLIAIAAFFMLRIFIYSFGILTGEAHSQSGSRVLSHIFPVTIAFMVAFTRRLCRDEQRRPV